MKKYFAFALTLVMASTAAFADPGAKFGFKDKNDTYSFGNLKEGDNAEHNFEFVNNGDQPLIIQKVNTSCGCTTPDWSKQPILPGKTGFIKVTYNTKGNVGVINKQIYIKSNASKSPYTLKITGNVAEKK